MAFSRSNEPPSHSPPSLSGPTVFSRLSLPKPTPVFNTYWLFAAERHAVFIRRVSGAPAPWTSDEILREYKFTNAFRASDRVSQYLIRNVIYDGHRPMAETIFRILLFKIFNRIETWQRLVAKVGDVGLAGFSIATYDQILSVAFAGKERLYSAAYIMPAAPSMDDEPRKHTGHLRLLQRMLDDQLPHRLMDSGSMARAFSVLRSYPSIGDFLAYQFVTDLNYSDWFRFSESEFVVPGPGARDGLRKCFESLGDLTESDAIRWVMERQETEFVRLGLEPVTLWGRALQLIDCQNLFCEVDKYARVRHPEAVGHSGRTRIKQRFSPAPKAFVPWYPPNWAINDRLGEFLRSDHQRTSLAVDGRFDFDYQIADSLSSAAE